MEQQQLPFDKHEKLAEIQKQIAEGHALVEAKKKEAEEYLAGVNEELAVLSRGLLRLEGARVMLREMGASAPKDSDNEDA